MVTLYGIANCDTVRKARKWLDRNGVDYRFHDVRKDGLSPKQVGHWIRAVGREPLLNRRSPTWRSIPESRREGITDSRAAKLMLEFPTVIKRPVLEDGKKVHVGFASDLYESLFS